ncbi:hypothetical protein LXH09_36220 [Streptomyces sp. CS7]|uniref:hypothetical protein n=1 Tax=Streptomyces sp. CS-7 TaxID=2906769 RepID=UPI0021B3A0C2|nr:hypothetical protein [Streptomyces sp. CS-7]MCT6782077.1 hypothetical protein [Streptomyces sp. CS-7]
MIGRVESSVAGVPSAWTGSSPYMRFRDAVFEPWTQWSQAGCSSPKVASRVAKRARRSVVRRWGMLMVS